MTTAFTRLWKVREIVHLPPVRLSDESLQDGGREYRLIETIEARDRAEAERIATERHPGAQIDVARASE